MATLRGKSGLVSGILLAVLLVAAQTGAVLHAYEHDPGAPQTKVCSTCTTASQLAAACIDGPHADTLDTPGTPFIAAVAVQFGSTHILSARQRGPPVPL